jgi:uridine phosphorylase
MGVSELISAHTAGILRKRQLEKNLPDVPTKKTKVPKVSRPSRPLSDVGGSSVPLLERDPARLAIIEPSRVIRPIDIAEHCVFCFFQEVIRELAREGAQARHIHNGESEAGDYPVYELDYGGRRLAVVHPGVGAPNAAARLEHMIALGCRKFIACGGAGVLVESIDVGNIVVPTAAIRDEGTSYHYLPPSREVAPTRGALRAIEAVLRQNNHDYHRGKTWTTDAVYRETRPRMERRRDEGCVVVEMEAAAFFAVARFRRVEFAQILYGGDSLAGPKWAPRGWNRHAVRERLFHLAAEACLRL